MFLAANVEMLRVGSNQLRAKTGAAKEEIGESIKAILAATAVGSGRRRWWRLQRRRVYGGGRKCFATASTADGGQRSAPPDATSAGSKKVKAPYRRRIHVELDDTPTTPGPEGEPEQQRGKHSPRH